MKKRLSFLVLFVMLASLLASCGSNSTPAPAATTAAAAATTAAPAATTAAAAATTAAPAATTAAAAATTAAPAATTAAAAATTASTATGATTLKSVEPIPPLPAGAKQGGSITIGSAGLPASLAPVTISANIVSIRYSITPLLWADGLVSYNYTTLDWELDMAKDLKVSSDGKTYTFTLRPDLKWSDGNPITVDDFKLTQDNISKPNPANAALSYSSLQNAQLVQDFKVDSSAGTIAITMDKAYNRDVALNNMNFSPVPKKYWEGKPFFDPSGNPEIKMPSATSGPFKVKSYDEQSQGVFVRNDNWHRGKAYLDEIVVKSFGITVLPEALKSGQADLVTSQMPSAFYQTLATSQNLEMKEWAGLQDSFRYIVFNTTRPPFDDKDLRIALAHTVDRAQMIGLAEGGRATPAYSIVPEDSPFFPSEITKYPFDLAKAKDLLGKAGYKYNGSTLLGKDGNPLKFNISYSSNDIAGKGLGTYVQAQLKSIGIDTEVQGKDPQTYLLDLVTQKYDAGVGLVGDLVFPDPDTQKTFFIKAGVYNVAKLVIPRVEEIFNDLGPVEQDTAKRKALYGEALKLVSDNVPSLVFYRVKAYTAVNKRIGGVDVSKFKGGYIDFNGAAAKWYIKS